MSDTPNPTEHVLLALDSALSATEPTGGRSACEHGNADAHEFGDLYYGGRPLVRSWCSGPDLEEFP